MTSNAPTFKPVVRFCTFALSRVPRMLITAVTRMTLSATNRDAIGPMGTICEK